MSRNQFRLLVVLNQLLVLAMVVVGELTDSLLPPELRSDISIGQSVMDTQLTTIAPVDNVLYWINTAILIIGLIAAFGLYLGKRWGRTLFLLTCLAGLVTTLLAEFYISTGWTSFVAYLVGITDGMILGLAYFSHVKRMFQNAEAELMTL